MRKNIRHIILYTTLTIFFFTLNPVNSVEASKFNDLHGNEWYYYAVDYLSELDVLSGNPDGSFKPNDKVGVDQFIKMLLVSLGYSDIEKGENYWADNYIDQAMEIGLVLENEFTNYKRPITRGEMSKLINRALGEKEDFPSSYKDEYMHYIKDFGKISENYKEAILNVYSLGIISGYTDRSFRADNTLSRGEASIIIYRVLLPSERIKIVINTPEAEAIDREYNWYVDQMNTGSASDSNCGPSSTRMVALWKDENYNMTAKDIRNWRYNDGGWWYTSDITNYFDEYNIEYNVDFYDYESELTEVINKGHIMILCIDTTYLDDASNDALKTGKFYGYNGGHFLVVKGYEYIDGNLYYEVYDPNNWGEKYSDGKPKGKDRLYISDDLFDSSYNWWPYYIEIYN